MATLRRGRHLIGYEVHGEGPPLVMLRGLGRCMQHWLGYERELAEHYRVITMDLRGIGQTTLPLSFTHRIHDLAGDVVAVLDALGIEQAHVLGVSLGGMVALATGLEHPTRCLSVITINTSIAGQRTLRMSPRGAWAIASGLVGDRMKIHRNLVEVLTSSKLSTERKLEAVQRFHAIAATDGLYVFTALKQVILAARFHVKHRLPELQMPVLLVYGADDQFVPSINTRKLKALIPHARLVSIPDAGHELMMDQPEALRDVLVAWLDEHGDRRATAGETPAPSSAPA
jgi:pimeloyl-ACP methyl ester carboxylesterase